MKLTNKKVDKSTKNNIKIVLMISVVIIVLLLMSLMNIKNIDVKSVNVYNNIISFNYMLAFISVCTCFVYYYIYKRDEFFLITLVYISFAVEYLCENILIAKIDGIDKVLGLLILSSVGRLLLVELIIRGKNKITKLINSNMQISVIITIILTIFFSGIEVYFKFIKYEPTEMLIIIIFNIMIIIFYSVSIVRLAIKI
ncbi:MAG: hypothetical protein ACRDA5_10720, partial [Clostridium sp.]